MSQMIIKVRYADMLHYGRIYIHLPHRHQANVGKKHTIHGWYGSSEFAWKYRTPPILSTNQWLIIDHWGPNLFSFQRNQAFGMLGFNCLESGFLVELSSNDFEIMADNSVGFAWDLQGPPRTWDPLGPIRASLIPLPVQNTKRGPSHVRPGVPGKSPD